jgi:hypothetical protein
MSLKEGRKEGRRRWSWRVLCEKVPPARARWRNAPISSLHETGQQKAHNNCTLWDRTSGRRRWAFLGQPAHCGTKPRWAFLAQPAHCGTKPRWAFLAQPAHCGSRPNRESAFLAQPAHCGSRPNRESAFLGHRRWDQTKVGFSWTPLWDRTKPIAEEGGLFLDALVEPDDARPDQTKPKQTREKVGFSRTPLWNQTTPDRTRQNQSRRGRRWAFLGRPCGTRPRQTRPKVN